MRFDRPTKETIQAMPFYEIKKDNRITTIKTDWNGVYWMFFNAEGNKVNKCGRDLEETVELGSQQVTSIQVFHHAY